MVNEIFKFFKNNKSLLILFYPYALLHMLGWVAIMHFNDQEMWHSIFDYVYLVVFIPLNILNYIQIKLLWGTTNIFYAKCLFGIIPDFLIMTLISVHVLLIVTIFLKRKKG